MNSQAPAPNPAAGTLVPRHRVSTRLWHWINAVTIVVLLMSGLMIFNAHPHLYWGKYGANADPAWLSIGSDATRGFVDIGTARFTTTGVLGRWTDPDGKIQRRAFPWWSTIPSRYNLALARRWHLTFAWVLVLGGLGYWARSFYNGHVRQDLAPGRGELAPAHLWHEIKNHARLRFPTGAAALKYNILQKLTYLGVLFVLLPLVVLTGISMSPGMNAAWPWLLDVFGGRQSARSIHFIAMALITLFIIVHLLMVVLAGPWNEVRSMITGRYRLPKERAS